MTDLLFMIEIRPDDCLFNCRRFYDGSDLAVSDISIRENQDLLLNKSEVEIWNIESEKNRGSYAANL